MLVGACQSAPAAAPTSSAAKPSTTVVAAPSAAPLVTASPSAVAAALPVPPLPPKPPVPSGGPEKLRFATDFGFNGRHAPYFVALAKGFFRDVGLDVEIVRGAGSQDAIKQVGAGNAQVAFADMATLIALRANENVPVKQLSVIYNRPPQALYCLAESGIKVPKDLEGKRLADSASSGVPKIFPAYAKAEGIDVNKVTWVFADSTALPSLLVSKQVDCVSQFIVGQALLEKAAAPKPLVRFAFSDAPGMDFYSNGIVASDETIQTKPDVLRRFVYAVNEGLTYAFEHPDEAAQIMNQAHPEVDVDIAKAETLAVESLALTPETAQHGIGYVDPARVQKTIDIITPALELNRTISVNEVYAPGFVGP
jgi:NitT/TauT family transport system substrate-binding protein